MDRKIAILQKTLPHVADLGWTWDALHLGAKDAGFADAQAELSFPGGLTEAITCLSHYFDQEMLTILAEEDISALKIHERVARGIEVRLMLLLPNRDAVRQITRYLTHPARTPLALKLSYQTVNKIWYMAGDQSTDYNYYTKRLLLGYVYNSTLIYFAKSRAENLESTLLFMRNRFKEVAKVPKVKKRVIEGLDQLRNFLPRPFSR